MQKVASVMILSAVLSACGGGGASAPGPSTPDATAPYVEPPIPVSFNVAQQCESPRPSGTIDPYTRRPYGDVQGSLTTEKLWIRAFVNETYLWYDEVAPLDPSLFTLGATVPYVDPWDNSRAMFELKTNFDVVDTYFNSQRSLLLTPSGKPKDQFHFTYATSEWLAQSTSGSSVGFGFHVELLASRSPRNVVVAYTEPGSAASANGLQRGAKFLSINGVDVVNGGPDMLNEGLFSPVQGKLYTFEVLDRGASTPRSFSMTAGAVTSTPVQNVRTLAAPYSDVGYLQFNDHIGTAEAQLVAAINQLKAANGGAGVSDLVLDLRYNGGGYLDIASELAFMIAGASATAGKVFERSSYNNKNPFGQSAAQATIPFHRVSQGFSTPTGQSLPQLGLPRVFVITGKGTCSASEAVINGLTGAGVQVILIGDTTCGKPYGFYPEDNCSVTYFTIQFKGVNHLGFGDYADGFIPGGTGSPANHLKGCVVADDFTQLLGDTAEARLAAALHYRANGACPARAASAQRSASLAVSGLPLRGRSPLRENRFLLPKTRR
ncbi:S41 family peptidase [Rhodoferax sp.]|uniref:S41 family peptidase n=1 Tax=Rhodoferax sp. TaxID=50421 RepID=UPI002765E4A8|nr:S41 family peptidase [Rhodoferax sp.]